MDAFVAEKTEIIEVAKDWCTEWIQYERRRVQDKIEAAEEAKRQLVEAHKKLREDEIRYEIWQRKLKQEPIPHTHGSLVLSRMWST